LGTIEVGSLAAEKCHITGMANKTRNYLLPHPIPRTLFLCSQSVYPCLSQAWKDISTLAFLVPDIDIITEDKELPIPLTACLWSKRAI
jgi:hypothetical protein